MNSARFIFVAILLAATSSSPASAGSEHRALSIQTDSKHDPSDYFLAVTGGKKKTHSHSNNLNHSRHRHRRHHRRAVKCANHPTRCRKSAWSGGPDCCGDRCVDKRTDFFHCGACGRMCRFGQVCCGGKCVDIMFNERHCGGCNVSCEKGSSCSYGMCGYAG